MSPVIYYGTDHLPIMFSIFNQFIFVNPDSKKSKLANINPSCNFKGYSEQA